MRTVLFAGGGTGGHLMPALAIAEAMVRLDPSVSPLMVGGFRGIEARVLPARPWRYVLLPFEPIYRRLWWRNARLPFSMVRTLRGIRRILSDERPVGAVGTGGYVAGPVLWAASRRRVPLVLQEQNAYPGLATRLLAPRARQIHLGFPEAESVLSPGPGTAVRYSGNPIARPPGPADTREAAKQRLGFSPDRPLVLVVGGSQGAQAINHAVDGALEAGIWPARAQLLWQTGAATHARYATRERPQYRVTPFIDPMAEAYAAADVVVGRAGAMTLAELAAWGLPAILVPLPQAAAGHQLANARALVAADAATLVEQHRLTPQALASGVQSLLSDPARMALLKDAMLRRARPDAAFRIAREVLELIA